ncbi:hypothetical protein PAI11_37910 [Patulibacter medicamentivorans]|uniref:DUF4878 domain-containing protein n=1 Tax=Patulibacter medicamentivorans TaxID=1097667 RepID=H0EAB7_9ACTN|nr:hypothetical protein [Patulibacter medicamentivorans]EHN09371.1 hypothetical protein PAI11_37910 [Patulibacter medicamentivorans]
MTARRSRLALLLAAGTIALGAVGCAPTNTTKSKDFSGVKAQVANTVKALDDAYDDEQKDNNGARTVCRQLLSKRLVAQLDARGGCEKVTRKALDDADPIDMSVQDVTIEGDKALAKVELKVTGSHKRNDTLTLVREGGNTWKLDSTTRGAVEGGAGKK